MQKGFTLIELLIVVAIIGALSAIATPLYGQYVARNEVASAITTLNTVKTPAELYIQEVGNFSPSDQSALFNYVGVSSASNHLGNLSVQSSNSLTFTFNNGSLGSNRPQSSITFSRTSQSGWKCSGTTNIPITLIPKGC